MYVVEILFILWSVKQEKVQPKSHSCKNNGKINRNCENSFRHKEISEIKLNLQQQKKKSVNNNLHVDMRNLLVC